MKLENHLRTDNLEKINKIRKEKLSKRDLRELMGTNRDTYKRGRGGATRRKWNFPMLKYNKKHREWHDDWEEIEWHTT